MQSFNTATSIVWENIRSRVLATKSTLLRLKPPQKPDSYPAILWRCSRLQETKHRTMCGYHNKKHVSKEKGSESEARTCGHTALVLRRGAELQLTFTGMLIETHSLRFKTVIYSTSNSCTAFPVQVTAA